MSKFTPGPWKHSKTSNIANMVVGPNDGCIATVQAEYSGNKKPAELESEGAANIRLIAIAPAMYELIEQLAHSGTDSPLCNSARAILAKVEK